MSTPAPEAPEPYSWLPAERVRRWLQLEGVATDPLEQVAEDCRRAAADYCQSMRPDLVVLGDPATFLATDKVVQAGVIVAARLYARRTSPAGLASYGEFGAAEVLRMDPDAERLLGVGRWASPVVG